MFFCTFFLFQARAFDYRIEFEKGFIYFYLWKNVQFFTWSESEFGWNSFVVNFCFIFFCIKNICKDEEKGFSWVLHLISLLTYLSNKIISCVCVCFCKQKYKLNFFLTLFSSNKWTKITEDVTHVSSLRLNFLLHASFPSLLSYPMTFLILLWKMV